MEDDDRLSSADSFSLVEDQNKADDFDCGDEQKKENVYPEPPSKSTTKVPTLVEVAKVTHNDFVIRIFTDAHSPDKYWRCFYFEPVVLLDPRSIKSESNGLLKQDLVQLKIKMWDASIRAKVIERIRSLPGLKNEDVHEEDVHVMPYEQVQLTVEPGSLISSIKLKSKPICYSRMSETLSFQFECASADMAVELADNFKTNPELFLEQWELALECRDLALGIGSKAVDKTSSKGATNSPTWIFKVSTLTSGVVEGDATFRQSVMSGLSTSLKDYDKEIQDLKSMILSGNRSLAKDFQDQIQAIVDSKLSTYDKEIEDLRKVVLSGNGRTNEACSEIHQDLQAQMQSICDQNSSTCVPVFSVENCTNPAAAAHESLRFSSFVMDAKTKHGDFDLSSGIFTVKTAGYYQLNFTGHVYSAVGSSACSALGVNLKVNRKVVATSLNQSSVETGGYQTAVISTLLPLKTGDKVGIFALIGKLFEKAPYITRFHGILFSE